MTNQKYDLGKKLYDHYNTDGKYDFDLLDKISSMSLNDLKNKCEFLELS
jgi:hypothetical protein